jgi:hypothetical protein
LRRGLIPVVGFVGLSLVLLWLIVKRVWRFGWRRALSLSPGQTNINTTAIVFYERLLAVLERRGVKRDPDLTPLEFAESLGLQPALAITRAYNRVRFGGQHLSAAELREIESTLKQLEGNEK